MKIKKYLASKGLGRHLSIAELFNPSSVVRLLNTIRAMCMKDFSESTRTASALKFLFGLSTKAIHILQTPRSTRIVLLQHRTDTFTDSTPDELVELDMICLFSSDWMELAVQYFVAEGFGPSVKNQKVVKGKSALYW